MPTRKFTPRKPNPDATADAAKALARAAEAQSAPGASARPGFRPGSSVPAAPRVEPAPFVPDVPESVGPPLIPREPKPASGGPSVRDVMELRRMLAERAARKLESLALFEPTPEQERFFASPHRVRLMLGGNRSGKTTAAAVDVARALSGRDPHGKFPAEGGRCFAVGLNLDHVGQTMWRKLGRAGAFKIIKDEATGEWRAFRPWEPGDAAREDEAKPAPPLIPPRMIKSIAWEFKAKGIPKQVHLNNGWEIAFYSSEGPLPQGVDADLVWFDEEIAREEWFAEMVTRLIDRRGRLLWSATPQAGTVKLFELNEWAEEDAEKGVVPPRVAKFHIRMTENPHITEEMRREVLAVYTEEEAQVRSDGEFAVHGLRVFPEWSPYTHLVDSVPVPPHWTRYAVIDPGRQVCCVLFFAVPPPDEGKYAYLYDELYIHGCSAELFGRRMSEKANGQQFQAFIIDHHGGRITEMGSGRTVESLYSDALRKYRVESKATGTNFLWGGDDVQAGVEAARSWLRVREDGTTRLRVLRSCAPNFEWEIKRYRYKVDRKEIKDEPESRGRVHAMADLRYIALFDPKYARAESRGRPAGVSEWVKRKQDRRRREQGGGYVNMGPGKGVSA